MGRGVPRVVRVATPRRLVVDRGGELAGSIAFLIAAFAAYIDPETGTVWRLPLANLGTFVGAVGFFVGALLLIPEMRSASAEA